MKIVDPLRLDPIIDPNNRGHTSGATSHRRILTPLDGGPASLDVGYNQFRGGIGGEATYAYRNDELCYTVRGGMDSESQGTSASSRAGMFMWRPAGVQTNATYIREDTVTICAFGPARKDGWSHKLSPAEIPDWRAPGFQPRPPLRRHYSEVEPTTFSRAPDLDGIVHREVFSAARDGSFLIEATHTAFSADTTLANVHGDHDEVWYVAAGSVTIGATASGAIATAGQFVIRAFSENLPLVVIASGTMIVSFSGLRSKS